MRVIAILFIRVALILLFVKVSKGCDDAWYLNYSYY